MHLPIKNYMKVRKFFRTMQLRIFRLSLSSIYTRFNILKEKALEKHCGTRYVCETLMPPKHQSFEKHDPDI